jgi:diguanylate cyclase (GGDEF)-like protein
MRLTRRIRRCCPITAIRIPGRWPARRRGHIQAPSSGGTIASKVKPMALLADEYDAPRVSIGGRRRGKMARAFRVNNSITVQESRGLLERINHAASPGGRIGANSHLLPRCLRLFWFAGLFLALYLSTPGPLSQVAGAASPAQAPASLPTVPTGNPVRGPAAGSRAPNRAASLPELTSAKAVHSLTRSQAQRRYPVHFRAVCVVCFADWHGFWVYDGVSGVYVETRNHVPLTTAIHPGTVLDIDGVSGPGSYKPVVDEAVLRIVGEQPLPPAPIVNLDRLSIGDYDGQWFAIEGTVHSAVLQNGGLSLIVNSGRWQINAITVAAPKEKFERLIGARVRIGATGGALVNTRRQAVFLAVYAPSIDNIQVLRPPVSDPFSLPLTPISRLLDFQRGPNPDDLIRIRGVVSARLGRSVFIQDGAQGTSITSLEPTLLKPGELVDAVGYRSLDVSTNAINDASFKRLGAAPVPDPKWVTAKEAATGDSEDELVRIKGRLIEVQHEADQETLLIADGNSVFSAILPAEYKQQGLGGLSNAREIQLTGVCLISESQSARDFWDPKAFHILLRSPADLVVVSRASWWTAGHTLLLLAVVLAGTTAVLMWVVALRRRVAEQTALLRESEERFRHMALHDALTGLATRLLFRDRLDVALASAARHRTRLAMLMVDLDRFKEINDTHGHQAGDEVLRITASRLLAAVREEDTVSRLGGDEFVVLLPNLSDPQSAERTAERIVQSLAAPYSLADRQVAVTVSVGVCTVSGKELDADDLMKRADDALYRAKANGRNCYAVETPELAHAHSAEAQPQGRTGVSIERAR